MLATVVMDAYSKSEILEISEALETLCDPRSAWSASGVYIFWDIYSSQILYMGLASNLHQRFCQHNGIINTKDESCKYKEIIDYFSGHDRLGYTIILQSVVVDFFEESRPSSYFPTRKEWIQRGEGQLISSYINLYGALPLWNKIRGSLFKRNLCNSQTFFDVVTNKQDSPIVARANLREVANDYDSYSYEVWLHGVRLWWLSSPEETIITDPEKAIESTWDSLYYTYDFTRKSDDRQFWDTFENMKDDIHESKLNIIKSKYHERRVKITSD